MLPGAAWDASVSARCSPGAEGCAPWSCRVCLLELKCVPLELRDIALDLRGVHSGAEVCTLEMHCSRMGPLELKGATPGAAECAPGATKCALKLTGVPH